MLQWFLSVRLRHRRNKAGLEASFFTVCFPFYSIVVISDFAH